MAEQQYTRDQLLNGLQKAHLDGNTDAAKAIANRIVDMDRQAKDAEAQAQQQQEQQAQQQQQQERQQRLSRYDTPNRVDIPVMDAGAATTPSMDLTPPERTKPPENGLRIEDRIALINDIEERAKTIQQPDQRVIEQIETGYEALTTEYESLNQFAEQIEQQRAALEQQEQRSPEEVEAFNQQLTEFQERNQAYQTNVQQLEQARDSLGLEEYREKAEGLNADIERARNAPQIYDSFLEATGKSLQNVPERFQQSFAGLVQLAGDTMNEARLRDAEIRSDRLGISVGDYMLLGWAGNNDLIDPQMRVPEALEYVKENIAQSLTPEQLNEVAEMGVINPQEIAQYGVDLREQAQETMRPVNAEPGSPGYYASSAIGSTAEMAPALVAAAVTRNPQVAMSMIGGQVYGQEYATGREQGMSVDDAQVLATARAAAEAIPEYVPITMLLKPGASVWRRMGNVTVANTLQETLTEALNIGIDMEILNADMTWSEARTRLVDAGIIGGISGPMMQGVTGTVQGAQSALQSGLDRAAPERQIGRQMMQDVEGAQFDQNSMQEFVRNLFNPKNAQVRATVEKPISEMVMERIQEAPAVAREEPEEEAPEQEAPEQQPDPVEAKQQPEAPQDIGQEQQVEERADDDLDAEIDRARVAAFEQDYDTFVDAIQQIQSQDPEAAAAFVDEYESEIRKLPKNVIDEIRTVRGNTTAEPQQEAQQADGLFEPERLAEINATYEDAQTKMADQGQVVDDRLAQRASQIERMMGEGAKLFGADAPRARKEPAERWENLQQGDIVRVKQVVPRDQQFKEVGRFVEFADDSKMAAVFEDAQGNRKTVDAREVIGASVQGFIMENQVAERKRQQAEQEPQLTDQQRKTERELVKRIDNARQEPMGSENRRAKMEVAERGINNSDLPQRAKEQLSERLYPEAPTPPPEWRGDLMKTRQYARRLMDSGVNLEADPRLNEAWRDADELASVIDDAQSEVTKDEPEQLDQPGEGTLERVSADTVQETAQGEEAGRSTERSGGVDVSGDESTGEQRIQRGRSVANDEGEVPVPATGETGEGQRQPEQQPVNGSERATEPGTQSGNGERGSRSRVEAEGQAGEATPRQATNAQPTPSDKRAAPMFTIAPETGIGEGGAKTKFKNNLEAIKTLKQVRSENRDATPEEQAVMAKYVGWGGLPQAFMRGDKATKGWEKEAKQLKDALTQEEYDAARRSTQDAHYTSYEIVDSIWKAVKQFGFEGGKVLEPSVGTGNFLGIMPGTERNRSSITAVELDPITGGMAKLLYPRANVQAPMGFQDIDLPNDYFDVAIGNPPFGNQKLYDGSNKTLSKFSIHNYFFAKSLQATKENGVLAMVVSSYLMDGNSNKVAREWLSKRADLLGAIRLPNNAFLKNAGTQVTTDIIFLRKRREGEPGRGANWLNIRTIKDKNGKDVPLNEYFADNPDAMLGEFGAFGSMYGPDEAALVAREGQDTNALLQERIAQLPKSFMDKRTNEPVEEDVQLTTSVEGVKVGSFYLQGGEVRIRTEDKLGKPQSEAAEFKNDKARDRVVGMVQVRDAFTALRKAQLTEGVKDAALDNLRTKLNKVYDAFVKKNGPINHDVNKRLFRDDPTAPQIMALEDKYDKGITPAMAKRTGEKPRKPTAEKAAIFKKRTQSPYKAPTSASSGKDALTTSLAERGAVDMEYMRELYDRSEAQITAELGDLIFEVSPGTYETRDQYLSGNVRKKLAEAKRLAKDDKKFTRNVEALQDVQPTDIEAVDIDVKPGAPWLGTEVMQQFVTETLDASNVQIAYNPLDAKWSIRANVSASAETQWGTSRVGAAKIIETAANQKQIIVRDSIGDGKSVVNEAATNAANEKVERVKAEFRRWIWKDDKRREQLQRKYNDVYNTDRQREYDGSHLTFPGKVSDSVITLRPHQADAVWRMMQSGTVLLDHVVGAGKTYTMVAGAMEMRRIGKAKKPMFVVPNHLVGQWAADFVKLYPGANVLQTTKKDFDKNNRKRLFARIATGDWDAVIVAHSQLTKVEMDPAYAAEFIKQQIADIEVAQQSMREQQGKKDMSVKQLEKSKERLQEKLKKLFDAANKDDNLTFAELGVDALFLDEAHEYKNLAYATSMTRVGGLGNTQGSQKAQDMFMKVRYIMDQTNGNNVIFATGTPISNTMAEMFTVQRYLDYDSLKDQGLAHFDAWANMYGEVVTDWELSPSGNYKLNSRFSKFVNMPELMQRYLSFGDVINRDDIARQLAKKGEVLPIPKIKGGKPNNIVVERSEEQAAYIGEPQKDDNGREFYEEGTLIWRSENLPKKPEKGADNMLKIMSDARKAALDMRLIDPVMYDDNPNSKINQSADRIKALYDQWADDRGAQLVFIDLSTPKGAKAQEAARIRDLIERADDGDEVAQNELDKMSPDELDAIQGDFSVYDDLRLKLINRGIPENEIAFIHDANTEQQKEELFGKVRSGRIRVLLGSTAKMGAGMNVQERLVALHHLDAPWRPSDLEQREGRIIRQGNLLYERNPDGFEVEILRYATKNTLDSRMWQTIETKARFIEQVRKGNAQDREIEDVAGEASNAAEMKAASSGNPLILEEMDLRQKIRKLEQLESEHDREQFRIQDRIRGLKRMRERAGPMLEKLIKDEKLSTPKNFVMTVAGTKYDKRADAGEALLKQAKQMADKGEETRSVGKYGDFDLLLENISGVKFELTVKGNAEHQIDIVNINEQDAGGLATKVGNIIKRIGAESKALAQEMEQAKKDIPKLEQQIAEFPQAKELSNTKGRHALVIAELQPASKSQENVSQEDQVLNSMGADTPMQNWWPMYRQLGTPPRPEGDKFELDGKQVKIPPEDSPTRREGIRQWLEGIIGPRVYDGKVRGQARLGFYRRNNGEVRVKDFDDVEVMAHEMAHWLDMYYGNRKRFTKLYRDKRYKDEVQDLSYTSDDKLKGKEGFAEYVRLWLTQHSQAKNRAPLFTVAFEKELTKDSRLNKQMRKLREEMHKWYQQGARAQFRAKSGKELSKAEQIIEWQNRRPAEMARQKTIDRFHAAKVVERMLKNDIGDATDSAYKLFQMTNGSESMHEAIMRDGTPVLNDDGSYEFGGKGLNEIFAPAAKKGWAQFDLMMEYFKARRADELMKQGRERLFTEQEIAEGLKLGAKNPEFATAFEEFQEFNQRMLDFYEQMGLITKEQRDAFAEMNQNYVPFHRVIESIETGGEGGARSINKRLSGGTQNVRDIASNIVEGLFANVRAALEARAKQMLYTDIMQSEDGALFAAKLGPDSRLVQVELSQMADRVAQAMAASGISVSKDGMIISESDSDTVIDVEDVKQTLLDNPKLLTFWTHGHKPNTLETYVDSAIINGKKVWFEVRDPLLVDMFTGFRNQDPNAVLKFLFAVKNMQTRLITSMVQFLTPNAVRDTVSASILSRNNFVPVYDTLKGMGHFMFNTDTYKQFRLQGGGYGTRIEAHTQDKRSRRQLDLPSRNLWDASSKFIAGWDRFSSMFEYGSRLGDFSRAMKAGKTPLEAAWEAREVATDFSKHGNAKMWSSYLRTVPFMNAGIQGLDKTTRAIMEIEGEMKGKNLVRLDNYKAKFLAKGSVLVGLTALLWLVNQDDERYQALTPDQKARFWWIFPPGSDRPIKIPRPYDIGHIFGSLPEVSLDYIKDRDGQRAAEVLAWTAANTMGVSDYPGFVQPIIERLKNRKFTGAPVVPTYMEDLSPELQFTDRTPLIYLELGEALGVSPMVAEHYAKGYFRYLEAYMVDASEAMLWNEEEWGERPFTGDGPIDYFTHQFEGQKVPYRTRWTEGYYSLRQRAQQAQQDLSSLTQTTILRRDTKRLDAFAKDEVKQALLGLDRAFAQIDRAFSDQNTIIGSIKYNPDLSAEEKEKRIERYYEQKNEALEKFYLQAEDVLRKVENKLED